MQRFVSYFRKAFWNYSIFGSPRYRSSLPSIRNHGDPSALADPGQTLNSLLTRKSG